MPLSGYTMSSLACFGSLSALIGLCVKDWGAIAEKGFFFARGGQEATPRWSGP